LLSIKNLANNISSVALKYYNLSCPVSFYSGNNVSSSGGGGGVVSIVNSMKSPNLDLEIHNRWRKENLIGKISINVGIKKIFNLQYENYEKKMENSQAQECKKKG